MTKFVKGTLFNEPKIPIAMPISSIRYITTSRSPDGATIVYFNANCEDGSPDYIKLNELYDDIKIDLI